MVTSFWQKWQKRKQKYNAPTIWWDNGKTFTQGLTKDFCTTGTTNAPYTKK